MAEKKSIEKRLPPAGKLLLAIVKFCDQYFPIIARYIVLNRFYRPIRFSKSLYYPPIFKQADKFKLSINGKKITCYSWGKGPVLLLCHGWSGWAGQMAEFVEPFLKKGFNVITFDGPAHGLSQGKKTNQIEFVDVIKEIDQSHGPITALIAHSYGGVCILMALKEGINAKRAVIIGTPASLPQMIEEYRQKTGVSEKTTSIISQHIKSRTGKDYHEFSAEYMGQFVNVPVLIVHDKDDTDVNYHDAKILSNAIKHSTLYITEGKGHRRILKDKEVMAKVMDFVFLSYGQANTNLVF
jgi:pimeloyl-ACP methyl ester carboxylesterase